MHSVSYTQRGYSPLSFPLSRRSHFLRHSELELKEPPPLRPAVESHSGDSRERLSDLLHEYLKCVLLEFELTFFRFFSSTIDSGSDAKRLCKSLLGSVGVVRVPYAQLRSRCGAFRKV